MFSVRYKPTTEETNDNINISPVTSQVQEVEYNRII